MPPRRICGLTLCLFVLIATGTGCDQASDTVMAESRCSLSPVT